MRPESRCPRCDHCYKFGEYLPDVYCGFHQCGCRHPWHEKHVATEALTPQAHCALNTREYLEALVAIDLKWTSSHPCWMYPGRIDATIKQWNEFKHDVAVMRGDIEY